MLCLQGRIACTRCIDAAYCYECSVVCAYLSVGHNRESYKNGRTDLGAVLVSLTNYV